MRLIDLLTAEPNLSATPRLREGRDFHNQRELQSLRGVAEATPATRVADRRAVLVAELAAAVLHELEMFAYTGTLPRGGWSEQPAWRVDLWLAYWQAESRAHPWPDMDDPECDYGYE